jgi:hypothetical protein
MIAREWYQYTRNCVSSGYPSSFGTFMLITPVGLDPNLATFMLSVVARIRWLEVVPAAISQVRI